MQTSKQTAVLSQTAIALAIFAAFNPVHAQESDVAQLIKPESSISVGVGTVSGDSKDRAIFGQYTGMRRHDVFGLVDFDYVTRDDATGTWTTLKGANLGLTTREVSFSRERQGDWKYSAEYSELERDYLRTINTGMTGAGTTTPSIHRLTTAGTGSDVDLKTERKAASLAFEKWISPSLQFEANFKNEEKTGARLWARGYACETFSCVAPGVTSALLLMPEAIDSVTKQIDAKLNFHTDKLLLTTGYYGSFYNNANGSMRPTVPNSFTNAAGVAQVGAVGAAGGGASLQTVMQSPMALPPDNEAHQFYLDGNYSFTNKTRGNFKLSYSQALQNDDFAGMGLLGAPAGRTNLGGRVNTTLAQAGFTTSEIDKLTILGNVRYEDKDDKTQVADYNVWKGSSWLNSLSSYIKVNSKLEASYRLPANLRATLGYDENSVKREVPKTLSDENVGGLTALRGKNTEKGYRAELRSSMSETLNGGISYASTRRSGEDWTSLSLLDPANPSTLGTNANPAVQAALRAANLLLVNQFCGGVACYGQKLSSNAIIGMNANAAFPIFMTDAKRDKWKLSADWNPTDSVSVQFGLEDGSERNLAPYNSVAGGKGWRGTESNLVSVDATWAFSDNWKLTGYASHGNQVQHINHSSGYRADIDDKNDTASIGLIGKITGRIDVGASVGFVNDVNKYNLDANSGITGNLPGPITATPPSAANLAQATIGLPNATYRQIDLKLFAKYALDKQSAVRFDLVHQRAKLNEWQWESNGVPFVYSDNTSVTMQQAQNVTLVGVSYIHKF